MTTSASVVNVAVNQGTEPSGQAAGGKARTSWGFNCVPAPRLPSVISDNLSKWGLGTKVRTSRFSYDTRFQPYDAADFLHELFNEPKVRSTLEVCTRNGAWGPLQQLGDEVSVSHEVVKTTWINLEPILRLRGGPVRENDMIVKCFDESYEGIVVSDELRKVFLAGEESEFSDLFTEEEQSELLYRLLGHLVIGGPLCQYEDSFKPYVDAVREIYKSLVKVVRSEAKQLYIVSHCYKVSVQGNTSGSAKFFPGDTCHPQNFCYVCIDPIKRYATVLYGAWDD